MNVSRNRLDFMAETLTYNFYPKDIYDKNNIRTDYGDNIYKLIWCNCTRDENVAQNIYTDLIDILNKKVFAECFFFKYEDLLKENLLAVIVRILYEYNKEMEYLFNSFINVIDFEYIIKSLGINYKWSIKNIFAKEYEWLNNMICIKYCDNCINYRKLDIYSLIFLLEYFIVRNHQEFSNIINIIEKDKLEKLLSKICLDLNIKLIENILDENIIGANIWINYISHIDKIPNNEINKFLDLIKLFSDRLPTNESIIKQFFYISVREKIFESTKFLLDTYGYIDISDVLNNIHLEDNTKKLLSLLKNSGYDTSITYALLNRST